MAAMEENAGEYIVVVDGSVPLKDDGIYSTIAGITNLQMLEETCKDAFAVIAVGSCATFGGIPGANPNPTGAVPISDIITDKPIINISGCPPIPEAMTGTISYLLSFGSIPELDHLGRPKAFFGEAIHDRCYRRPFYERGMFAKSFDDEGARQGWCLFEVGCKGPVTYNACATLKWNGGVSFPIQSGHGCLGCSEPDFWDMGGFYKPLSTATGDPPEVRRRCGRCRCCDWSSQRGGRPQQEKQGTEGGQINGTARICTRPGFAVCHYRFHRRNCLPHLLPVPDVADQRLLCRQDT